MRAEAARRARERAPLAPSGPRRGSGVGGGAGGHAAGARESTECRPPAPRLAWRALSCCCSTTATSSQPTSEGPHDPSL